MPRVPKNPHLLPYIPTHRDMEHGEKMGTPPHHSGRSAAKRRRCGFCNCFYPWSADECPDCGAHRDVSVIRRH